MTKARDIADFKFENITDTGTEGTKVATGTTAQRGSTQGQIRFNSTTGLAEYYTGTAFKSIDAPPTISSIDDTEVDSAAGGNQTIVITGSGFNSGATVTFVGNGGTDFNASTVTVNSDTQITAVAPKASFLNAQEPYGVKVTNVSGLSATLASQINVDNAPTFNVASGTLGTITDESGRVSSGLTAVTATDADGDAITFAIQSGSIPAGLTFNANGTWSGTANAVSSNTTSNFSVRATANSKTSDRAYTITVQSPVITGHDSVNTSVSGYKIYAFTTTASNRTLTVGSNVTADVLMVAGGGAGARGHGDQDTGKGGGGAGGVLYRNYTLTAGSYTLYVGRGGTGFAQGDNGGSNVGKNGESTTGFGVIALGGGGGIGSDNSPYDNGTAGTFDAQSSDGGSGGGGGARRGDGNHSGASSTQASYTNWTKYGNSGGNSGAGNQSGGGGGGAGGSGSNNNGVNVAGVQNNTSSQGGAGGVGVNMSGTFGTGFGESGYFAGGGGGGTYVGYGGSTSYRAAGGNGGGGDGVTSADRQGSNYFALVSGRDGQANTGGGGGGSCEDSSLVANSGSCNGAGGSGIILIRIAV